VIVGSYPTVYNGKAEMRVFHDRERLRLEQRSQVHALKDWIAKAASFATGLALLVLGFVFSLLLLAAVAAIGLGAWAYVWWKSRELRQRTRSAPPGGRVIEGEVLGDSEVR
jgi:hypothetical protein